MSDLKRIELIEEDIHKHDIIEVDKLKLIKVFKQVTVQDLVGQFNWEIIGRKCTTYYVEDIDRLVSVVISDDETYVYGQLFDTKTGIWIYTKTFLISDLTIDLPGAKSLSVVTDFIARISKFEFPKKEYSNYLNKTKQMILDSENVTMVSSGESMVGKLDGSIHNFNKIKLVKTGKQLSMFD